MPSKEVKKKIDINNIKVGMEVYIPSLDQVAKILSLPNKKQNVLVQVGILKMNVHISQIEETKQEEKKVNVKISTLIKSKAAEVTTEIKLLR